MRIEGHGCVFLTKFLGGDLLLFQITDKSLHRMTFNILCILCIFCTCIALRTSLTSVNTTEQMTGRVTQSSSQCATGTWRSLLKFWKESWQLSIPLPNAKSSLWISTMVCVRCPCVTKLVIVQELQGKMSHEIGKKVCKQIKNKHGGRWQEDEATMGSGCKSKRKTNGEAF